MAQYRFTLKGFFRRCREEYVYFTRRPWSLADVGAFWDTVVEYDDVNEGFYTHDRRFTDSYAMAAKHVRPSGNLMLDVQSRSGKGTLFWYRRGRIARSVCVDFSEHLMSLARRRLTDAGVPFEQHKVLAWPLPFADRSFDLVCSYETVEHVFDYAAFIRELARVMKDDGTMVVTCPNVAWEWVHWLTAALNINHSEGPHRFLHRGALLRAFEDAGLHVLENDSRIFLPFNNRFSVRIDQWMNACMPACLRHTWCLRQIFILRRKDVRIPAVVAP